MKKIFAFIVLVVSFAGMAQGVTITTDKTATQLINEVLISPTCNVAAENVISSTGSTAPFGSTNGIGYFTNISPSNPNLPNNPNFPFKSGVVLTTGNVTKVPSPNNAVLSDGVASWPGDTDMQTALAAQGVTINSINASYLQFEFIATTQTFNLDFIFASEEYGASQCNYSDAFAFLIKNVTDGGSYQNVATVPFPAAPGTPITVDKIRDALYNPGCSSVNKEFFGAYNGGGFGPAINFNGQTVPMTASANLILGKRYRVKLVIADGNNNVGYDSAIFLKAQTLNIGGEVLGLDYVLGNAGATTPRTGVCPGGVFPTLQPETPLPANTLYQWKKDVGVVVAIPGATSSSLNLNTLSGAFSPNLGSNTTYILTYTIPGCTPITEEIIVQSFPAINALASIPPLYKCKVAGATSYNFEFGSISTAILNGSVPALNNVTITFHASQFNANNNINAVTNIDITGAQGIAPGYEMFVRITKNTGCYETRSFRLILVDPPTIIAPPLPLTLCGLSPAALPRAIFNFTNNINLIRGTTAQNPDYNVMSFYLSQPAADAGGSAGSIPLDASNNANLPSVTVFVRFQNVSNPGCYVTTSFIVTVTPLAAVDILPDVIVCNNFVLPTLTQAAATYWTLTGGPTGGGTQLSAGDVQTPGATPSTIWVYNENGSCKTNDSFKITKANLAQIAPANSTHCETDNYPLPALAYGKYYKYSGGPLAANQVAIPAQTIINTPGANVYYVWFENLTETPVCGQEYSFTVSVTPFINLLDSDYSDKFDCNSYTFNPAPVAGIKYYNGPGKSGGEISLPYTYNTSNSQKTIFVYKESPANSTCTSESSFTIFIGLSGGGFTVPGNVNSCTPYTLPDLDFAQYWSGSNGTGTQYPNGSVISAIGTTTIFFYVPGQACTGSLSFTVTISLPALAPISDVPAVCDQYTFPYIASHTNGKYYTGPLGTGLSYDNAITPTAQSTIYTQGTQTIYFYAQSTSGSCYVQDDFQLTINPSPAISQRPVSVVTCNQSFVLDALQFGNYYKFSGGPSPTNPALPAGTVISSNDAPNPYSEIWVYSGSTNPLNTCFQEYSRKIYLVNTVVNPIADVTACDSYTLPAIVGPGKYYPLPGGPLVAGNTPILPPYNVPSKLITTTKTLYVYAEDNNRVPCSDQDAFTVTIVRTPNLIPQTSPISVCDSYIVPQYNDPMFTFTPLNPGVITKFYKNPGGAAANPGATDVYTPGQVITNTNVDFSPKTVILYPYTELLGAATPCYDDEPFTVIINRTPIIVPAEVVDVPACNTYTLPALTIGKYYSSAAHTQELTGLQLTLTNPTNTVYVYAETGTTPNCFAPVEDFVVTIFTTPVLNVIAPVASCDTYIVPQYNDAMFTFSTTNPGVVTKFYKNSGGPSTNPLATDEYLPGQSIANNGATPLVVTMYAYSAVGPVPCFDDEPLVVTINKSPVIIASEVLPITRCDSYTLPTLTVGNYFSDALHTTPITNYLLTGSQTVYVYAETATSPNCTDIDSFAVTIVPTPTVSTITPIASCDTYIVPQYNDPMFTSSTPITKFYKNAGGPSFNPLPSDEYTVGQIIQNTTTTPLVVTIYAYTQAGSVPCFANAPLVVTINKSPVIVPSEVVPVTKCDSYTLTPLTFGNYFSDALHTNPITNLTLTSTQIVYVYAKNGLAPDICSDSASFLVTINNTPQFNPAEVANVSKCDKYILPALSTPLAKYYTGANATGSEILPGTAFTNDTTVFVYAETGTVPNCFVSQSFNIQIYNVIELQDVTICGGYTLPNLADPNANYYTFSGGTGLIAPGTTLTASQTVFVRGTGPSGCADESDFIVTINGQPIANDASDAVCDNDSSPYDGITPYDLTTLIPTILGTTQLPTDFTVTFYSDFNRTVPILTPTACTLPIVYVFVTNNLSSTCPSPAVVTISVVPLPNPKLDVPPICIDSETGIVTNSVIESGYNSVGFPSYTIVWSKASDGTVVSNNQTFSTDVPGDYILNVSSNLVTTCASAPVPFTVIESAKPAVTPPISFEIAGWFTNSQTITVNATPYVGDGSNFAYSLDGQTPQDDNVFYNVGLGAHEITVIDKNGCGTRSLPIPVQLVTSPPSFTPNGDGINDRWDIKGEISYSTLTIYDRFGRMLKQLSQNSGGWDGTINSQTLPADDYWFSVNYIDSSGAPREYKSHFSLIR